MPTRDVGPDRRFTARTRNHGDFEPVQPDVVEVDRHEAWNGISVHTRRTQARSSSSRESRGYIVQLSAPKNYNQPSATAEVDVVPLTSWLKSHLLPSLLAAAFLVTAAALTFATRKRHRVPEPKRSCNVGLGAPQLLPPSPSRRLRSETLRTGLDGLWKLRLGYVTHL
jgi:hypothetical protein